MTCYLVGGCVRATWERVELYSYLFGSHYAIHWAQKVKYLMLVFAMASHPKWSYRTARTWYRNQKMVHT